MGEADLARLRERIRALGRDLVACPLRCEGVVNDPAQGVIPRCLYLEEAEGEGDQGAVVIGLNPGRSDPAERALYLGSDDVYGAVARHLAESSARYPYYRRIRELVRQVGIGGPLLWTELAKCENAPDWKGALPVQTYRTCAGRFLKRELEALPGRWPAFAVGREAFQAAAYLLTDRPVVGVPHPTGSHFSFQARIPDLARRALRILESTEAAAGWLDSRSGSAG